ncbi:esterase/lipase family protein [Nocardia niigatensis]|uniref:esterase/lipase family protein n=1 Tax=Nocardia niigatensis TaxID=209249 RepID=UPI0002F2A7FD|nr:alpha/beta fold hydrolase [Nocardia niigatensis]
MARTIRRALLGTLFAATVGLSSTGPAQAGTTNPIQPSLVAGIAAATADPAAAPPGVNPASCRLTSAHPHPVVLVTGTFGNMIDDFGALGPILANDGYCVYSTALNSPSTNFLQTVQGVPASAAQIAALVDSVIARYGGNTKVDLVGHSQGGLIALYVAKVLAYSAKIHAVVGLGASTHGTTLDGLGTLASLFPGASQLLSEGGCQGCADQLPTAAPVRAVDTGPIAQPGVSYTMIATRLDTVVTPASSSFIDEPGVADKWIQDSCWNDTIDHPGLSYDNTAIRLVLNALSPATAKSPNCLLAYPLAGAVQQ